VISEELPTTTIEDVAEDLEVALLSSCREIVAGFSSLGADPATLPRTPHPRWRSSISRHVDATCVQQETAGDRIAELQTGPRSARHT
jgi:hypothetical protein